MDFEELNNDEEKNTEHYLNELIKNQKKANNLLRLNTILVLAIIVIKLFVTG